MTDLLDRKIELAIMKCYSNNKFKGRINKHDFENELMNIRITKQDMPLLLKKYSKKINLVWNGR